MLGTIVNVGCILSGSIIGSFVSKGINEKYKTALFDALGLATIGLGANAFVLRTVRLRPCLTPIVSATCRGTALNAP